jgi:16S rRNA (cytosine1402-N4)-methyltransferase
MIDFNHFPVMRNEAVENLRIKADGIYADLTLGGGSHTLEIAKYVETGRIIAVDRDAEAIEYSREKLKCYEGRIIFVQDNYANIKNIINSSGYEKIDGALMDCGVSSYQIDEASRGFSYMRQAALDMRQDRGQELTAADIINNYEREKLRDIIYRYGEERCAELIIREIIKRREIKRIETTLELADIIKYAVRNIRYDGGHPAKRTFQAVRIAVNGEIDNIGPAVDSVVGLLNPGGRFVAVSFHSIEDRAVKQAFVKFEKGCSCPADFPVCVCAGKPEVKIITRKPVYPGKEELAENTRSASAKMRVLEKL